MKPRLYSPETTTFTTNGIGVLSDAISCRAFPAFGEDELKVKYPLTGTHYADIRLRSILVVKPDPFRDPQPYRVYKITSPMSGIVTIYARHIAYDLSGIVVTPFNASSAPETIWRLKNNAVTSCPFSFQTDVSAGGSFSVTAPSTIWSVMGGREGSILDVFGGEYQFDGYTVHLWNHMGSDRGVSIRYGKNLTSLEQDENCANCYTGVAPYWLDSQSGEIVTAPGTVVSASGSYGYTRILPLDLTDKFQEKPSVDELLTRARKYMTDNKIGEPAVSWKVEFVQLEKTVEYKGMALLERISLGDTVHVEFPLMGVSATARAVSAEYDCLLEHYVSVTLGSVRQSIANTIVSQQKEIQKKPSMSVVQTAMSKLTDTILGAKGGAVRLLDTDGDGSPDELYIADNKDPAQAVKVWRYNYEGWACSQSGYEGPFVMGATLNDGLLASFVTAAKLVAGTIQSADGETFFLDLDNGILKIKAIGEVEQKVSDIEDDIKDMTLKIEGIDGTDFYIKYSQYEDGHAMTDVPDDSTQYMGTCSTNQSTAPTDYKAYTWCRIKGQDGTNGTPGTPGADGKTQYLHIKYSDDGKTFTAGQNLVSTDFSNWESGYYDEGALNESDLWIHFTDLIPVIPGEKYTISANCDEPIIMLAYYASADISSFVSSEFVAGTGGVVTIPEGVNYAHIHIAIIDFSGSTTYETYQDMFESGEIVPVVVLGESALGEELGAYIGTLVDFTEEDSLNFNDYTWKKFTEDVDEELTELRDAVTELEVSAEGITAEMSSQKKELDRVKTSVAEIKATSEEVTIQVQKIVDDGAAKLTTGLGLTINETSVDIHRPNGEMTNSLDDTGMYVIRDKETDNEEVMLQANADGVIATDVTVRNYLTIAHARFEDYSDGTDTARTACFFV